MFKTEMTKAIHQKLVVIVTFDALEKGIITRKCIPYDIGPSSRSKDKSEKYHFCDLDSPDGRHTLSILPERINSFYVTDNHFNPGDYITWEPNWILARDWGIYS